MSRSGLRTRDRSEPPPRVQPLAALIYREPSALEAALERLAGQWGPVALAGAAEPFDRTDYYEPEMGAGLMRVLAVFERLQSPEWLIPAKLGAAEIETDLAIQGRRTVNIDVGYLDLFKLVLASFKGRGNKVYLDQGVWADITLIYRQGRFEPLPWSFPDFASGRYETGLKRIREGYRLRLRETGETGGGKDP
ncbi:MAG: DUF4416 family protein [Deltaproteobacteria bacterium]|nr:DUF4416 family protein [Deltaproteobacteria bacterium]